MKIFIFLLFIPIMALATPCEQADELVIEAYHYPQQQQMLLREALELCPTHPTANNNLAVIQEGQQKYAQALKYYQRAIKANHKAAWLGVGSIYYQQKQFPLSLEAYLRVCNEHPIARKRVTELLQDNRYKTADEKVILNQHSLQLLYDSYRLQTLYQQATSCRQNFRSISTNKEKLRLILVPFANFQALHFQTGKHDLNQVSDTQLNEIAKALANMPKKAINIKGHADIQTFADKPQSESDQLNWELSKNRAESVKLALIERGITGDRMSIYAYGNSKPLVKGNNSEAFAKNRRVEIGVE